MQIHAVSASAWLKLRFKFKLPKSIATWIPSVELPVQLVCSISLRFRNINHLLTRLFMLSCKTEEWWYCTSLYLHSDNNACSTTYFPHPSLHSCEESWEKNKSKAWTFYKAKPTHPAHQVKLKKSKVWVESWVSPLFGGCSKFRVFFMSSLRNVEHVDNIIFSIHYLPLLGDTIQYTVRYQGDWDGLLQGCLIWGGGS